MIKEPLVKVREGYGIEKDEGYEFEVFKRGSIFGLLVFKNGEKVSLDSCRDLSDVRKRIKDYVDLYKLNKLEYDYISIGKEDKEVEMFTINDKYTVVEKDVERAKQLFSKTFEEKIVKIEEKEGGAVFIDESRLY